MTLPPEMLRIGDVLRLTGKSESTLYREMREGRFPSPVRIGLRAVAWPREAIEGWRADVIARSNSERAAA